MDQYLDYIGGPAGALALTGVAAASAFYLASRPTPQKPLVELHRQSRLLPVSTADTLTELASSHRPCRVGSDYACQT
jgi:long-chain acyl-CoA synthetase